MSENTTQYTTTDPEILDLRTRDIVGDKKAELLQLFPEIRTEGAKIHFDKLRLARQKLKARGVTSFLTM